MKSLPRPLIMKFAVAVSAILLTLTARAATRHWDGGGTTGLWDAAANWSNNVAPVNGDALFFPTNVARLVNTNRATSTLTNIDSIRFTGDAYNVFSVPVINLTNGLTNASAPLTANTLDAALQLRRNQTWAVSGRNTLTLNSNVNWTGFLLTNDLSGTLVCNGNLVGAGVGRLIKEGTGRLELNGAANQFGGVIVVDGTLQVDGALTSANTLVVSNGATLSGSGSVSAFTCAGDVQPGGGVAGVLTQTGAGNAVFESGSRLFVNLNGLVPGADYDQFKTPSPPNLSGATLLVLRSFSFPFAIGQRFVIITNTGVSALSTAFANLAQNARLTNSGVVFQISYTGGTGNDVELTVVDAPFVATGVTRVWDGGGTTTFFSNPANWVGDVAPQDGDSILFPTGLNTGDNLATNNLAIRYDQLLCHSNAGGMTLAGLPLQLAGGIIATQVSGTLTVFNDIAFIGSAAVIHNADGRVLLHGAVDNGGHDLTLNGGSGTIEMNGVVSGDGGLLINRPGQLLLSRDNTYRGVTRVPVGQLNVSAAGGLGDATSGPTFVGTGIGLFVSAPQLLESSLTVTGFVSFSATTIQSLIEVQGTNARIQCGLDDSIHFQGPITGNGRLRLAQGRMFIENTHAVSGEGITIGSSQGVFFNGSGQSAITLQGLPAVLGGTGEIGTVSFLTGTSRIEPGASPGVLTTSNLLFNVVTTNVFELNGTVPGTGHDQLRVRGSVNLGGAPLRLSLGYTPTAGDTLVIIDNDGSDAVTGTYAGLAEGALIPGGALAFRISYAGGSGNDVTLTAVDAPFIPSGITRVWDGEAGSGNRNWSTAVNWNANVLPARGDDLVFPASAPLTTRFNNNNLSAANAVFNRIWFGGVGGTWNVQGGALKIFGGVIATNDVPLGNAAFGNAGVELIAPQTWRCTNVNLALNAPLLLGGHTLTLASGSGGAVFFQSSIIGTGTIVAVSGDVFFFTDQGADNVAVTIQGGNVFAHSGTHTGPAWQMSGGQLRLGSVKLPGLQMTGGTLDLSGPAVATNHGSLTLAPACTIFAQFDSTVTPTPTLLVVTGQVNLAGARLTAAPSDFSLLNTPLKLIDKTSPGAITGTFAGLPEGGFLTATNEFTGLITRYRISYAGGNGNDVTLTPIPPSPSGFTRTWTGAGANPLWNTAANWSGNTPPSNGDTALFPFNAAQRVNTNPAPGLVLDALEWIGSNYLHSGTLSLLSGLRHGAAGGTNVIAVASVLATLSPQTWAVSNAASTLRLFREGDEGGGEILGLGPVTKTGAGTLELENIRFTLIGGLALDGGTSRLLNVNLPDGGQLSLRQGRLEAVGLNVDSFTATNGELALLFRQLPAVEFDPIEFDGGLSASQNLTLNTNVTVTVQWTNGINFAAMEASTLDLGNARLNVTFPPALPPGETILLARHPEGGQLGEFANLPDGTVTNFAGRAWQIHYNVQLPDDFSGNLHITLTPPVAAPVFTSIERLPSGDVLLHGTAVAGSTVSIEASEDLVNFTLIGSTVANAAGQFTFLDSAPAFSTRFYRALPAAP